MFRSKSGIAVLLLLIVAALFGCQCGTVPPNKGGGPGPGPGLNQQAADPAEQAAVDMIKGYGGFATQENGKVVEVGIFRPGFTEADFKTLSALSKARKIQITSAKISGVGVKELAACPELTYLNIGQNPISDSGVKEVASLKNLKYLKLAGMKASDAALRELAPLTQLEELVVSGTGVIGNSAGVNIAAALPKLKRLAIDNNGGFGDIGLFAVAGMPELKSLHIYGTRVTDKGLAALPKMKNLEELRLGAGITDVGLKAVGQCKNLRVLSTFNSSTTDKGLRELNNLNLKELEINNSIFGKISNEAMAEYIKAHPQCTVKGP